MLIKRSLQYNYRVSFLILIFFYDDNSKKQLNFNNNAELLNTECDHSQ